MRETCRVERCEPEICIVERPAKDDEDHEWRGAGRFERNVWARISTGEGTGVSERFASLYRMRLTRTGLEFSPRRIEPRPATVVLIMICGY